MGYYAQRHLQQGSPGQTNDVVPKEGDFVTIVGFGRILPATQWRFSEIKKPPRSGGFLISADKSVLSGPRHRYTIFGCGDRI